jgi:hypothetical protein
MATVRNWRDRTVAAMIFWVLYKRSEIAHGTGGNKRGVAVLKILDYVIAEPGALIGRPRSTDYCPAIANRDSRPTGTSLRGGLSLAFTSSLTAPSNLIRSVVRRASRPTSC